MGLTATQLLADQAYWFADFPQENFTVGATTYACVVPRVINGNDWQMGGLKDEPKASVIFNRNAAPLPSAIPEGTIVSFRGENWRVVSVRHDWANSPMLVELESARLKAAAPEESLTTPGGEVLIETPGGVDIEKA